MKLDIEEWHDFIQREKKQWLICYQYSLLNFELFLIYGGL